VVGSPEWGDVRAVPVVPERLEGGELPLEESLKAFERGVALTRECQVALEAAQARVDILLKRDGEVLARPFDDEAEGEPDLDGDHSPT
jgi:exodeoxyribonuclease VII small subunit